MVDFKTAAGNAIKEPNQKSVKRVEDIFTEEGHERAEIDQLYYISPMAGVKETKVENIPAEKPLVPNSISDHIWNSEESPERNGESSKSYSKTSPLALQSNDHYTHTLNVSTGPGKNKATFAQTLENVASSRKESAPLISVTSIDIGFTTGLGKSMNPPSEASVSRIRELFEESSSARHLSNEGRDTSIPAGFTTGAGLSLKPPSAPSVRRVSELFKEPKSTPLKMPAGGSNVASESLDAIGFTTGTGKNLSLPSESSVKRIRAMFDGHESDSINAEGSNVGRVSSTSTPSSFLRTSVNQNTFKTPISVKESSKTGLRSETLLKNTPLDRPAYTPSLNARNKKGRISLGTPRGSILQSTEKRRISIGPTPFVSPMNAIDGKATVYVKRRSIAGTVRVPSAVSQKTVNLPAHGMTQMTSHF